MMMTKRRDHSF